MAVRSVVKDDKKEIRDPEDNASLVSNPETIQQENTSTPITSDSPNAAPAMETIQKAVNNYYLWKFLRYRLNHPYGIDYPRSMEQLVIFKTPEEVYVASSINDCIGDES